MDHATLLSRSMDELRLKTDAHDRLWQLSQANWGLDQQEGTITFTSPNGMVTTCAVQIVGTYTPNDSTWLWAWDHPSVDPPLRKHAETLKEYGQTNQLERYTKRKLEADEMACWEFAALACHLNDAQGAYRCPAGSAMVFVTFGDPQISSPDGLVEADSIAAAPDDFPGQFTSEIPDDVRAVVTGFITALYNWEVASQSRYEQDDSEETLVQAEQAYATLIQKWCVPNLSTQPISFGSDPSHHPEKEQLVSSAIHDNECRVATQHEGSYGFTTDYEYRLLKIDNQWKIASLDYVDEEGKYPML